MTHKSTGLVYYGVRTTHALDPVEDLGIYYFSSSNLVHSMIEKDGKDAFSYEVRRVFSEPEKAMLWEERVLKKMKVKNDPRWLNQNDLHAPPILSGSANGFFGRKHDRKTKQLLADKAKRRWNKNRLRYTDARRNRGKSNYTPESLEKMRNVGRKNILKLFAKGRDGQKNPMWGKRHGVDAKQKMREAKLGVFDGQLNPMYGKKHNEKSRNKISESRKGTKWINMNGKTKCVPEDEVESHVMTGWTVGRTGVRTRGVS